MPTTNVRKQNVWKVLETGQLSDRFTICGIKLIGGSDATSVSIQADSDAGAVVYEARCDANIDVWDPDLELQMKAGAYVTISGTGAIAYLYLE